MKTSDVYFTASIAAEKVLPPESRALIERHDELSRAWGAAGWPSPMPFELSAASAAMHADPLANAAIAVRVLGNDAYFSEQRSTGALDAAPSTA